MSISTESTEKDKSEIKNKLALAFAAGPSSQVVQSSQISASYSGAGGKHKKGDQIEEGAHVHTIVGGSKYHQAIVLEAVMQKGKLRPIGIVRGVPDADVKISPAKHDSFEQQQQQALKAAAAASEQQQQQQQQQAPEQGTSQVLPNGHITCR